MNFPELEHVERCLEIIRRGGMIVLVDDEDRENEGDLVVAAEHCHAEHVNFMCREGRGLICLALTAERVKTLGLPMMVPTDPGHMGTAFTVSIEARRGVTTGISAADRAETIRVASDDRYGPQDVVSPGHIFPLRAQAGGVLVRSGHTEGSVDLARMAGLRPAGVICEIMRDDGEMARMDDLEVFAARHKIEILTIAELIAYRLQREILVDEVSCAPLISPSLGIAAVDGWTIRGFRSRVDPRADFVVLSKGELRQPLDGDDAVLLRAQRSNLLGDVFGIAQDDSASRLRAAVRQIDEAGRGVFLYVIGEGPAAADVSTKPRAPRPAPKPAEAGFREFGLGAQVLKSLGVRRIQVMTDNPRKIIGLEGYGIATLGSVPLTRGIG
ncbi:MAG: 3,4-dihydroxy-2-butanone-4-phosphate synthase [Nannocystis sp.]|nr:3,4-dihydroxy-2-butanone-4-phosphate synthase [Nannocystis sp.]